MGKNIDPYPGNLLIKLLLTSSRDGGWIDWLIYSKEVLGFKSSNLGFSGALLFFCRFVKTHQQTK